MNHLSSLSVLAAMAASPPKAEERFDPIDPVEPPDNEGNTPLISEEMETKQLETLQKMFEENPKRVACPQCKSEIGEPCNKQTLGRWGYHKARVDSWQEVRKNITKEESNESV